MILSYEKNVNYILSLYYQKECKNKTGIRKQELKILGESSIHSSHHGFEVTFVYPQNYLRANGQVCIKTEETEPEQPLFSS